MIPRVVLQYTLSQIYILKNSALTVQHHFSISWFCCATFLPLVSISLLWVSNKIEKAWVVFARTVIRKKDWYKQVHLAVEISSVISFFMVRDRQLCCTLSDLLILDASKILNWMPYMKQFDMKDDWIFLLTTQVV